MRARRRYAQWRPALSGSIARAKSGWRAPPSLRRRQIPLRPRQQGLRSRERRQGVSELVVEAPSEGLSNADVDGDRLVTAPWIKRSSEIDADGADAREVEKAHARRRTCVAPFAPRHA